MCFWRSVASSTPPTTCSCFTLRDQYRATTWGVFGQNKASSAAPPKLCIGLTCHHPLVAKVASRRGALLSLHLRLEALP